MGKFFNCFKIYWLAQQYILYIYKVKYSDVGCLTLNVRGEYSFVRSGVNIRHKFKLLCTIYLQPDRLNQGRVQEFRQGEQYFWDVPKCCSLFLLERVPSPCRVKQGKDCSYFPIYLISPCTDPMWTPVGSRGTAVPLIPHVSIPGLNLWYFKLHNIIWSNIIHILHIKDLRHHGD